MNLPTENGRPAHYPSMNSQLPITDNYKSLFTFIIIIINNAIVHNVHKINSALYAKLYVFFAVKYTFIYIIY